MSDFDYKAMAGYMERDKTERDEELAAIAACKEFLEAHGYVIRRKDEVTANTKKLAKSICDSIDNRPKQLEPRYDNTDIVDLLEKMDRWPEGSTNLSAIWPRQSKQDTTRQDDPDAILKAYREFRNEFGLYRADNTMNAAREAGLL